MNTFKHALTINIIETIKELRKTGTVSMGIENLLQVTPTPKAHLEGAPETPGQYQDLFAECCEQRRSIKSFLL